jgi:hypothetical protein
MAQAMTQQRSEFEARSPNTSAHEECMLGAIVIDACCWGHYLEMSCATALGELRQDLLKIARTIDTESSHAVILKRDGELSSCLAQTFGSDGGCGRIRSRYGIQHLRRLFSEL